MAKIRKITEEKIEEHGFSDKLDVYKYIADIKLRLKDDISNDFVLAKLDAKDKEAIIEMTSNAYYSKRIIMMVIDKCKDINYPLSPDEIKLIKAKANAVFDEYMKRIYMIVVLNRNVDENYIINVLSNYSKKENTEEVMPEPVKVNDGMMPKSEEDKKK